MFPSTHPCGVRPEGEEKNEPNDSVSTHAPLRGATAVFAYTLTYVSFQLTHPVGCDDSHDVLLIFLIVSTHAPLRGATTAFIQGRATSQVSTHAPLRGATGTSPWHTGHSVVSTHAPLRGATDDVEAFIIDSLTFQLTHPYGVRQHADHMTLRTIQFQLTHPYGVRPTSTSSATLPPSFNSRTPTGCDCSRFPSSNCQ